MGTIADFLGIEFDYNLMQARLPTDKLARARNTAKDLLNKATISHQELESAVGFLSFAAKVVIPGRAFLRRLFDALSKPATVHRITSDMKADLRWWHTFLDDWDGLKLLQHLDSRPTYHIWTDASGKYGMGGYIQESTSQLIMEAFSVRVPTRHRRKDIQFKEMKAVQLAIQLWLPRLRGSNLILYCDNDACIHGLQKSSILGPAMAPLRDIALLLARNDIHLVPVWIPTKANQLADDLSRFRYRKIADAYPQLRYPPIPPQNEDGIHQNGGISSPICPGRPHASSGGA